MTVREYVNIRHDDEIVVITHDTCKELYRITRAQHHFFYGDIETILNKKIVKIEIDCYRRKYPAIYLRVE